MYYKKVIIEYNILIPSMKHPSIKRNTTELLTELCAKETE